MRDIRPSKVTMNGIEIKGKAVLCFEENGMNFQGVIHAKDDAQYAVYGTKSDKRGDKWNPPEMINKDEETQCGCKEESDTGNSTATYDIRIVDCEVGEEYNLSEVHGENGEHVTLRCKYITFTTTQTYKGQKADLEAQKAIGQKMSGRRGTIFEGPIEIFAPLPLQENRPWLL